MDNKELRKLVVGKFEVRKNEFNSIKSSVEAFVVSVLLDCKDVLEELEDPKKVLNIIIDEIDERTSTGVFDAIDGMVAKQAVSFLINDKVKENYAKYWKKAVEIIDKERLNG